MNHPAPDDAIPRRCRRRLESALEHEMDPAWRRRMVMVFDAIGAIDDSLVLDCGCGRGFTVELFREVHPGGRIVGVDLDLANLAVAASDAGKSPSSFCRGDAVRLPFGDATFHAVVASEVIEHIEEDRGALHEISRVLIPGGVLALTVPNLRFPRLLDPINALLTPLGRPVRRGTFAGIWAGHVRLYERSALLEKIRSSGLAVEESVLISHACVPFQHLLLYGLGKELLLAGLLPERIAKSVRRGGPRPPSSHQSHLVRAARWVLRVVDHLNDHTRSKRRSVSIGVVARKPE